MALLTVPVAGTVYVFGIGGVMSTAACSNLPCRQGPSDVLFGVLLYGAPVVAVLTIGVSFYTAKRERGIVVPLVGLALLVVGLSVLAVSLRQ